uniref:Transient receptor potential cation channel subfamily M member 8 n=1 Tax=Magallana gigas TaxID=29159 RepID=K1QH82_MAGGI
MNRVILDASKVKEVWNKIQNGVNSTPTMVFSVIGDSDSFVPKPWPKTVFQTALIEAAKSGGETWILYRGNEKGVSRCVREAYQSYGDMEFGNKNTGYGICVNDTNRHIKLISIARKGAFRTEYLTDPHFETNGEDDDSFLLEFEKYVSEQDVSFFSQKMDIKMPVPIAVIVCEGDIDTIVHISEALKNKLPVIIMKGSGKAADLVFDFLENERQLKKKASVLFGIRFDDKKYSELKAHLDTIDENRDLVGVFDLDQDDPLMLSNIVGEAVISCWSMENILQRNNANGLEFANSLNLRPKTAIPHSQTNGTTIKGSSLAWKLLRRNSVNPEKKIIDQILGGFKLESRPYVLNPKFSTPTSLPLYFYFGYQLLQESDLLEECGPVLLLEALKANRCDYVRVLLDQRVKFDPKNLPELYEQQIEEKHAKRMCHKYRCKVIKMNSKKVGEQQKYIEEKIEELHLPVAKSAEALCREILRYEVTGLVCSAILKKLSKKANNVKEQVLSNDLEEHSKLFEQRCLGIMDRMYDENAEQAIDLMDTEADIWGIHSCPLTFAYENFMYDVVAHTCSQKNMNRQWYNNLAPDLKPFLKVMFFIMLVIYSSFVLTSISTKYYEKNIGKLFEYIVYAWGAGDFSEKLISCFGFLEERGRSHRSKWSRAKRYLYDFWNVVDLLSYFLLIAAVLVYYLEITDTYIVSRRMFGLSLLVMYLRFLEVFLVFRKLGPTLLMIKEMLKDLLGFLSIAVFVVLGVGIYYHANLWPDHQTIWSGDWTNWRIWTIIYYPYWQLYAELNLDQLDGSDQSDCTNVTSVWESDTSINRCPQEDWTVQAVAAIYLLFSNLLLVNLVIAMFSYTFERVQNDSEKLWRFERYTVINDYKWRIPSPFNLFFMPYRCFCLPERKGCCLQKCRGEVQNNYFQAISIMLQSKKKVDTNQVKEVWRKIKNGVNSTPTMVFSVIGDSDSFVPKPWPKTVFQTALIEAAKSGGETWILYRGHEKGVSKFVREAYQSYGDMEFGNNNTREKIGVNDTNRHIKLIGIAREGAFRTENLTDPYFETNCEDNDSFLLDFEKYVSEQDVSFFSQKMDIKMPVPIAIILCEGDIETIAHIAAALENKLPVIIMKGSGKAADLVFDFIENEEQLRKKASVLFGIRFDDKKYSELKTQLKIIKENKDLVGVFDFHQDDPLMLSNIVGEAVVSCWSMENILQRDINDSEMPNTQNLRPKTAFPHSQTNGTTIKGSSLAWKLLRRNSVNPEKKVLLLEALKANRCDYVRVLLDQGVNFDPKNLPELYEQYFDANTWTPLKFPNR